MQVKLDLINEADAQTNGSTGVSTLETTSTTIGLQVRHVGKFWFPNTCNFQRKLEPRNDYCRYEAVGLMQAMGKVLERLSRMSHWGLSAHTLLVLLVLLYSLLRIWDTTGLLYLQCLFGKGGFGQL